MVEAEGIDLKGTSLNGKEKAIAGNKKLMKEKKSHDKSKHTVKVVDQISIKLA